MLQKFPHDHWLRLAMVGFISTAALGIITILPLILGELQEQYDFSKKLIGWFAAINIVGIAMGGLIAAFVIQKVGLVRLTQIGLMGLLAFELATVFSLDANYLLFLRFGAGTFAGVAYAASLTAFASLEKPVKGYSLYILVFCLLSAIIFPFMPYLMHTYGLEAGFGFLISMVLFALLMTPFLDALEQAESAQKNASFQLSSLMRNPTIWLVLVAYYALQTSGGAIWAYIDLIGQTKMVSENFIANTLSIGNLVVIPFAMAIYWINDQKGLALPIFGGLAVFMVCLLTIYFTSNPWLYAISTIFYLGIWPFLIAFYQSIQAHHDPQGKVIALGAFINMMGQATGPALAAIFLGNQPYVNIIILALFGLVLSLICIAPSVLKLERKTVEK